MAIELRELIVICKNNFQQPQKLKKRFYNKYVKLQIYGVGKKFWLNTKYIKIKQNQKLEFKFFGSFRIF